MNGTYTLIMELRPGRKIAVGKLGTFAFNEGFYVYVGSAMNGVERRVSRHISKKKKFHWHIDYLLEHAKILRALAVSGRHESELAKGMLKRGNVVVVGFGSSDTNVRSHLTFFDEYPERVVRGEMSKFGRVVSIF